jgi:hypothetical protein
MTTSSIGPVFTTGFDQRMTPRTFRARSGGGSPIVFQWAAISFTWS